MKKYLFSSRTINKRSIIDIIVDNYASFNPKSRIVISFIQLIHIKVNQGKYGSDNSIDIFS